MRSRITLVDDKTSCQIEMPSSFPPGKGVASPSLVGLNFGLRFILLSVKFILIPCYRIFIQSMEKVNGFFHFEIL